MDNSMRGLHLLQKARDLENLVPRGEVPGRRSLFFMLLSAAISLYIPTDYNLVSDMERVNKQYAKLKVEDEGISAAFMEMPKARK
jgi:hypothetical protein